MVRREACHDPEDIPIHGSRPVIESDGRHRTSGIGADALELSKLHSRPWEFPTMIVHNLPCGRLHVPDPAVIAEPLPQLHELPFLHFREVLHGGKTFDEAVEVGDHRIHPGLLQHDLGNPYPVWAGLRAPWHLPFFRMEPGDELPLEVHDLFRAVVFLVHSHSLSYGHPENVRSLSSRTGEACPPVYSSSGALTTLFFL